jgi:hypothetical protein
MIWEAHVALMGEMRNAFKSLVVKPEGKKLLGRRRRRWKDDIRMELRGIGWEVVDRIHLRIGTSGGLL